MKTGLLRLITLIVALSAHQVQATVCIDRVFQHEHLTLYLCQNHTNYSETRTLLYQARAQQLNQFIADLKTQNQLGPRKFEIQIWDEVLTFEHLEISRSSQANYISLSSFANFKELAQMVHYFAQPQWASFVYNPEKVKDRHQTRKAIESILQQYPLPNLSTYTSSKEALWQRGSIKLSYSGDALSYYDGPAQLAYLPNSNLPVQIGNRFLFFQADHFSIYQGGKELLQHPFDSDNALGDFTVIEAHPKWVNIGYNTDHFLYSYSYDQNSFYNLTTLKAK